MIQAVLAGGKKSEKWKKSPKGKIGLAFKYKTIFLM